MATYYLKSTTGTAGSGTGRTVWAASTAYVSGDRVIATTSATAARREKVYECTTGGTSGGTEPTWDATTGNTTADNTVTWTCRSPTTWANAHQLAHALTGGTLLAAGDTVYVSDNHAESTAGAVTIGTAGTQTSPAKWLAGDDAAEPPTSLVTSASITTTGATDLTVNGTSYWYGTTFISGKAVIVMALNADHTCFLDNCSLQTTNVGSAGLLTLGAAYSRVSQVELKNSTFKFAHANNTVNVTGKVIIRGGSAVSGTTTPTNLFKFTNIADRQQCSLDVAGFDFSNFAATINLFGAGGGPAATGVIRNCKLPASWSGSLVGGTITGLGQRYEMYNCDSADTNYRLWISDYSGTIKQSTTVYNDAGATDGTTRISWEMATTANAEYPIIILRSPEIVKWNDTTGSSVTVTVEIVHNSQGSGTGGAVQDHEVWLECQYLGTSGFPISTFISDCKADILATAADQASSSASWTGDSAGWDTQKLSVTFTPQEKGFIHAVVCVAKASATIYVDPLLTVA